jgi:hypothetical protein
MKVSLRVLSQTGHDNSGRYCTPPLMLSTSPMNIARRKKLEDQLAAAEVELVSLLRSSLPHTAAHGDMLFFNSRFRPDGIQLQWVSSSSEAILALAVESSNLRDRLGMPSHGSPGQLYIAACTEAADVCNGNRRGPRQLAAWLIDELGPD